jgi:hypothetical protein
MDKTINAENQSSALQKGTVRRLYRQTVALGYDDIIAAAIELMNGWIDEANKAPNEACREVWINHAWGVYSLWHKLAGNAVLEADREKLRAIFMKDRQGRV